MSRVFTDQSLLTWEVYATGGRFGLAQEPRIIFNCLSDRSRTARYVVLRDAHEADAEERVAELPDQELRALLATSQPL